jgi:hypothetical protein
MDGFSFVPELITQLAADLRDLSNQLEDMADRDTPDWMCLGTSRTATRFADAMCALAGDKGAVRALRGWAGELSKLADSHEQAASTYHGDDEQIRQVMRTILGPG